MLVYLECVIEMIQGKVDDITNDNAVELQKTERLYLLVAVDVSVATYVKLRICCILSVSDIL